MVDDNSSSKKWNKFDHNENDAVEVEDAIDDSDELDADTVMLNIQKIGESRRRQSKASEDNRVQEILGFPFLPNIRPLIVSDVESCEALEEAAFHDPQHRCSREKFEYRLATCPELCMGVFCTVNPNNAKDLDINTLKTAKPVETGRNDGAVSVLLAHIVSTRTSAEVVTDSAMDYPRDFRTARPNTSGVGHEEAGRTVAIHSLAVHPKLQGCGLGKLIMKAYLQQINNSGTAGRVALICQDYLVNYYKRFGFKHNGPSQAQFGGGGWHDMVFELAGPAKK
ncbi:uncharacterized protein BCR38DRAFT_344655 [Pseudomassariella vexata]|uniref:N-acetyltransferase domain-containing protein n=1 Tax=Pseudomassariella vexata TaxID=1141098 RepID=A0A1Y2DV24_9PEZI|nr:uncharacterized protein BCR38DRAFT_344655 [Pseudomassariella vexata]ORY63142.1 hypothetical protein BCR38DRAFT_344655 [Pseudomassariella vexata]